MSKREVKASLPSHVAKVLKENAKQNQMSVNAYARTLALHALTEDSMLKALSIYFKRAYMVDWHRDDTGRAVSERVMFRDSKSIPSIEDMFPESNTWARVPVRFAESDEEYERIAYLAFVLDTSDSTALGVLLNEAIEQGITISKREEVFA